MSVRSLTMEEWNYWQNRFEELKKNGFTKQKWCDLGHELMKKHNLSEKVAVKVLHDDYDGAVNIELLEESK